MTRTVLFHDRNARGFTTVPNSTCVAAVDAAKAITHVSPPVIIGQTAQRKLTASRVEHVVVKVADVVVRVVV